MYEHVCALVRDQPWAILPEKLAAIRELLRMRSAGLTLSEQDIKARIGAATRASAGVVNAVGVLPVFGVIAQRMNLLLDVSGGTSTEQLAAGLRAMRDTPEVSAIILNVDSPGGGVYGVPELAAEIRAARDVKPIVAVANSLAASAAYWLASAASEVVITPSGEVGGIGVFAAHEDWSKADETRGVKTTLVSAGEYKTEGNPFEPLSDEARTYLQARVDEAYTLFVRDVAAGRGVTPGTVRDAFGGGRVVGAKQALASGMVDRVGTFDETLARLLKVKPATSRAAAQAFDLDLRRRRLRLAMMS